MNIDQLSVPDILFYILGVLSILFALAAVCTPHILRAATYLVGVLCLGAGFYILLGAELLAGVQILVYVGGIVVLLVIAVMLTQNSRLGQDQASLFRKFLAGLASLGFFGSTAYLLAQSNLSTLQIPPAQNAAAGGTAIKQVGMAFLDAGSKGFLLPFELISLLLLAVLVAGIVIARKETP